MSGILSVMVPIVLTDAMIISSTAPETDYAVYNPATTYALGGRCISTVTHRIYESLQPGNIGHDPTLLASRTGVWIYWADVDPTNQRAMFDDEVSTPTVYASPLTVVLRPGPFNALFAAGLEADHITITAKVTTGGATFYSYSGELEDSMPGDYDEFFWDPYRLQTSIAKLGIDQYSNPEITVTLTSTAGAVKCGVLSVGSSRSLGKTLSGVTVEPQSFSRVITDPNTGKTSIRPGKAAKDLTVSALIDIANANSVIDVLTAVRGVPCVYICSDSPRLAAMNAYGLGVGKLTYNKDINATLSLNVQGLI